MTHYELFGIDPACSFDTLKKAYHKKARACHPDLFAGAPEKTAEFKIVVEAFNVLSDPLRRREYDESIKVESGIKSPVHVSSGSIMDTAPDDTLEELIVGNIIPLNATLMTLFQDLEKTEIFIMWREAKYLHDTLALKSAAKIFEKLVRLAPMNILYHVYFARCLAGTGKYSKAKIHYCSAISIGRHRNPPQNLFAVKKELDDMIKKHRPLFHKIMRFFNPAPARLMLLPDEEMRQDASRAMEHIIQARERKNHKQIGE